MLRWQSEFLVDARHKFGVTFVQRRFNGDACATASDALKAGDVRGRCEGHPACRRPSVGQVTYGHVGIVLGGLKAHWI